jgi:Zn-dependent protease with chaperone function/type II secretory pathway pseudopilin PulG
MLDPRLRSPKEQPLLVLGIVFSSLVWLALIVSIFGIFYGAIGVVFGLVAHALFLAHVRGNGVRVSERQLPDLYERCRQAARALGLRDVPEIYLMQAGGLLNAFATKLISRRYVIVYSDLVDHCQDPRQLDFVVAHEMGHIAAGHLQWNFFLWPYLLVPWLGPAYMRAREYTSDRCGLHVVNELEASMRGLVVLATGGRLAMQADLKAFMDQRLEMGAFWPAVLELVSTHPYLCKRVAALQEVLQPGTVPAVGRNPLAYPLAPLMGLATAGGGGGLGGMLVMVMMIGIIAAIAIPSLLRARISANESGALGDARVVVEAEEAYRKASGGTYGSKECLEKPAACIKGYQGPAMLSALTASATKSGYTRSLSLDEGGEGFTFVAVPMVPGRTGVRAFCADSDGTICWTRDGSDATGEDGRCDLSVCDPVG